MVPAPVEGTLVDRSAGSDQMPVSMHEVHEAGFPVARMGFRGVLDGVVVESGSTRLQHQQGERTIKFDEDGVQIEDEVRTWATYEAAEIVVGTTAFRLWVPEGQKWNADLMTDMVLMLIAAEARDTYRISVRRPWSEHASGTAMDLPPRSS
jgi:hypothetical protein